MTPEENAVLRAAKVWRMTRTSTRHAETTAEKKLAAAVDALLAAEGLAAQAQRGVR